MYTTHRILDRWLIQDFADGRMCVEDRGRMEKIAKLEKKSVLETLYVKASGKK